MVKCFSLEPMALEMLNDARERELEAQWFKRKEPGAVLYVRTCGGKGGLVERMEKVGKIYRFMESSPHLIVDVFFASPTFLPFLGDRFQ